MSKISKTAIDWAKLEKLVPPEERVKFLAFKAKSDGYFRRMQASPPEPPKIDWDHYHKLVPVPGLVDKFKTEYASFRAPYPEDKFSAEVDKQWKKLQPQITKYNDKMKEHIAEAQKEIAAINALPKFEDMTMETVYDMFPEIALDPVNNPTFWPHTDDEQLGYKDPMQKIEIPKK
ncbi:ATP synthase subunit d, mitochondrial [Spodoptera frugiperda]|uniref:ATP synthase subunit d, mitochondrial n=1 Tax=Spodoptera frugiperda TaxID=7108 RepID=A0A9R0DE15_SPOFR|nr:ATP synthase subunit d, mitochondrial [Spodoptera frugiperda]